MKNAKIQGYEMVLRSAISIAAASRSANSAGAFEKATKHLVVNMLRSITRRLEIGLFYGQSGIAKVTSVSGQVITLNPDEFAPGIFAGAKGMVLHAWAGDTQHDSDITVASVDYEAKTLTVTGTITAVVADDLLYFKGAKNVTSFELNEPAGLYKICTNTGTLFNIDASAYDLWKGNNITTAADISFSLIESAIAKAIAKGLADEDVVAFVNVNHWNVLLDDIVAKRQFDSSYSKETAVEGHKTIKFYGQNGMIEIVPSIYVKGAHCFIIPMSEFMRVGSTDVTFEQPGEEGKFFRLLQDANGYELRAYTDQALFCSAPGKCIVLSDLNLG